MGISKKEDVDDFLEVLRWSTEFGVNTSEGRTIKQGIVGVFAFNPKENVRLKDETEISLATYAARINIQLLKAAEMRKCGKEGSQRKSQFKGYVRQPETKRKCAKYFKQFGKH